MTPATHTAAGAVYGVARRIMDGPAEAALAAVPMLAWLEAAQGYDDLDCRLAALVSQPPAGDPAVVLAAAQRAYAAGSRP